MNGMNPGRLLTLALVAINVAGGHAQVTAPPDLASVGPQVGAVVPAFSGADQFGRPHTLQSSLRGKGAMLVFFRSADW
jgi:hypothetical protein